MKPKLLDFIVCPKCKVQFELTVDDSEGEEITEGGLLCSICRKTFPIHLGVPRILSGTLSLEKRATAEAFGYEWTHFTELTEQYEGQFMDWIAPVDRNFFQGKLVLDAGCGKGRHALLSAKFGAREVIGVDLSDAVDVAFAHTRHLRNVHIVQADIFNLPFRSPFNYIYSIGVLHHLSDPGAGFMALTSHLTQTGRISAWVYSKEGNGWIERIVNPIRTRFTSRIPKIVTKVIAFVVAMPMHLALKSVYSPVNRYIPGWKKYLFYNDYLYSISGFSFAENYSIVFDHLVAPTAFYISRDEFAAWFQKANLSRVTISCRNKNSWRGMGDN